MAVVLIDETTLTGIANAIRGKLSVQTTYKPGQMAAAITSIPSGSTVASGTYSPTSDTLTASFDVGDSSRTHFLICAASTPYGNSKRVSSMAFVDFSNTQRFLVASNSSGSSAAGNANFASIPDGFSMSGSTVTFTSSGSNSNQFCYFIGGITYRWWAW